MGSKKEKQLSVAMLGHKTILSRNGGVEVVVKELSERMTRKGIKVTCYNRREKNSKRPKTYKGIRMRYAWTIRKKGLAALTSSFFATLMILFSRNDIVHYHAEGPCAWLWIIKFFSKKKIIVTIHGLDWQRAKWSKIASGWIKFGEKCAVKYADSIIVLSHGAQSYFKEKYNRETYYVPNGVNASKKIATEIISKKHGLVSGDYILYLGRIVPEKGIHYLIDAYGKLNTQKKLVIAGGSSDTDSYYEALIEKANGDPRIIFTGFVNGKELEELYSNAYLYCLPSDVEGMPLSLLEAMSYGKCCLVSDIDECAGVIEENGLLFKKSNIEDLNNKLEQAINDTQFVEELGEKAKRSVLEKHNWDAIVNKTIGLYL